MRKNALIIGASGDIGGVIAKRLAKEGYQLLLHYHSNRSALDHVCHNIKEDQVLQIIQADLTKKNGIDSLLEAVVFDVGIIIFASGQASMGLFQHLNNEDIDEMLMLHVKAPLMLTNKLLPDMLRKRSGKIIFITYNWGEV